MGHTDHRRWLWLEQWNQETYKVVSESVSKANCSQPEGAPTGQIKGNIVINKTKKKKKMISFKAIPEQNFL